MGERYLGGYIYLKFCVIFLQILFFNQIFNINLGSCLIKFLKLKEITDAVKY
ncbi:hypothetical protein SAMN06296008_10765 [Polynucleobacter kasalickyi]|uniref:Uncharacterized protein n=1 Tax=Polynucleobacter kasalickyi TaxID=1938817 RepID=A0A1W2A351_9BURK|nr:hypothetical protein SAMN06296008_10765 [Polynucleobacter kasalickyi]